MAEDLEVFVAQQLACLDGPDGEDAFHTLIEAPRSILPLLMLAYHQQAPSSVRATIVEIVWQFRDPSTLSFLAEALRTDDGNVWKQALDGIVTLGGPNAVHVLTDQADRERKERGVTQKLEWIQEAIKDCDGSSAQ